MKYALVVLDGMADWPIKELNGYTPVQAARTTNIDKLVKRGTVGYAHTTPKGLKPGSDVCNFSLLGYNSKGFYSGRAPYEAASMGVQMDNQHMVFRCNLVTMDGPEMIDFSAGHIKTHEAAVLIEELNKQLATEHIQFFPGIGYRHILRLDTVALGLDKLPKLQCTPPHDIMGQQTGKYLPKGPHQEFILDLMDKAHKILAEHEVNRVRVDLGENPATDIWLWSQGPKPSVPLFKEQFGLDGAAISAVDLVKGIAKIIGLESIDVPGATGYYDTDYEAKGRYAIEALKEKDFVMVHVEATDEAGHNGHTHEKVKAIENIDHFIIGPMIEAMEQMGPYRMLIAPDHPTPVEIRTHTDDPVPFLMVGDGIACNAKAEYSEAILKDKDALNYKHGYQLTQDFLSKPKI